MWGGRKNGHNRVFDGKHPGLKEVLSEGQRCTTDLDFAQGGKAFRAKEAFWDFASEGGVAQEPRKGNPGSSCSQGSEVDLRAVGGRGGQPLSAKGVAKSIAPLRPRSGTKGCLTNPAVGGPAGPSEPKGHEVGEGAWPGDFGRPPGGVDEGGVEVEVEVAEEWAAEEVADFFGLG